MIPNLSKHVNKTILVSIPVLSGSTKCKAYRLTGIELIGLWLQSADLSGSLLNHEHKSQPTMTWSFFVPFSQIACVAIASAAMPASGATTAGRDQTATQSAATAASDRSSGTGSSSSNVAVTRKRHKE